MHLIYFASNNKNKYREIKSWVTKSALNLKFAHLMLTEIQADQIDNIAIEKAKDAFLKVSKPVLVEDDGLFVNSLNGFPGQYSSFIFKTLGNPGILKLLAKCSNRSASFISVVVFCNRTNIRAFRAQVTGQISKVVTEGGWGYDPIFIPDGVTRTYGQLHLQNRKSLFSHRIRAFEKFLKWYNKARVTSKT
jgi:XTP/dITP diphosphohydrolase